MRLHSVFLIVYDISGVIVCITLCTDTLGDTLSGGSFVVKVDINGHRISADENTQNFEASVQIATTETVFTAPNISRI